MATTAPTAAPAVQLRTIPLSAIVPIDGFNPRRAFDDADLRALSASMLERGCLVPVLVQATGDGAYRLVDGEKRYKAAAIAALMELPAIVRAVDAGEDAVELEAELLVDAFVANQLRSQMSPVEEALVCRRLKTEHGLTLKGIAQRLQMTQARVRDRLQILELPDTLWPRISSTEIPVNAISALVGLAKIHAGLPELAVTIVLDRGDVYDSDPYTWRDVAEDALRVVSSGLHDETVDAPAGVFVSSQSYALSAFTLDDKHQAGRREARRAARQERRRARADVRPRRGLTSTAAEGRAHPEGSWPTISIRDGSPRKRPYATRRAVEFLTDEQAGTSRSSERYVPARRRWERVPSMRKPRGGIAAAAVNGRIVVVGGEEATGTIGEVESFEPRRRRWRYEPRLPTPRHGLGAVRGGSSCSKADRGPASSTPT